MKGINFGTARGTKKRCSSWLNQDEQTSFYATEEALGENNFCFTVSGK